MRPFQPTHVLPWFVALGGLALLAAPTRAEPPAPPQIAQPADTVAVTKEDLRYDGKPFAYWRHYGLTELKAERRIECLRAMAAFGMNGYVEEATAAIVEMVGGYGEQAFQSSTQANADSEVISEARVAAEKMGLRAALVLLRKLESPGVVWFATPLFYPGFDQVQKLPDSAVVVLVKLLQAKDAGVRSLALRVLSECVSDREDTKTKLFAVIDNPTRAASFFSALGATLASSDSYSAACILKRVGARGKRLVPVVVEVLDGEAERCKKVQNVPPCAAAPGYGVAAPSVQGLSGPEFAPGAAAAGPGVAKEPVRRRQGVELTWAAQTLIEWLGQLGGEAKSAVPTLAKLFEVADDAGRALIAKTRGRISLAAPGASPRPEGTDLIDERWHLPPGYTCPVERVLGSSLLGTKTIRDLVRSQKAGQDSGIFLSTGR